MESSKNLPTGYSSEHPLFMKIASLEAIFRELQKSKARYLVVGGIAVIAHGYVRLTRDLDLVLDLAPDSISDALNALEKLGYRPILPVSLRDFADPELRKDWIENRHMKVFNLVSDLYPDVTVDIFAREPFSFETEYATATRLEIAPQVIAPVVSMSTLIAMKAAVGRAQDLIDIEKLSKLQNDKKHESK
jgi:hypothetical protein